MSSPQDKWRFCKKCNGLFYAGPAGDNPGIGVCPAGGGHDGVRSNDYALSWIPTPGRTHFDDQP
jgi:hypothetical protein